MGIRSELVVLGLALALGLGAGGYAMVAERARAARPHVIVFLADDLDKSLMPYLPHVRQLIAGRGASFGRYHVEQSTCCTSRATILSGQYVYHHGVHGNAQLPLAVGRTMSVGRNYPLLGRGLIPLEKQALGQTQEFPETYVESPGHARPTTFNGVVSKRWRYVDYSNDRREERYDLRRDPYELDNLLPHGSTSVRALPATTRDAVQALRAAPARLLACQGSDCRFTRARG